MPVYEITMILRSMPKVELVEAIKRSTLKAMDKGAIVTKMESLGHVDLPWTMKKRNTDVQHYTANYILLEANLPYKTWRSIASEWERDADLLRFCFIKKERLPDERRLHSAVPEVPPACTLADHVKSPAHRASVMDLRDRQHLSPESMRKAWFGVIRQWRRIPKSFTIAPHNK